MASKSTARRAPTRNERRLEAVQRRRRAAAGRSGPARRAARRNRRLKIAAAVVAGAAVAGLVFVLADGDTGSGPSTELRAERVRGAAGRLAIAARPESYRVVYRVEAHQGSESTVSTESIEVRRPFEGRVFIHDGTSPGGAVRFHGRSGLGVYATYDEGGKAQVVGDAPTAALGDLRIEALLDELVAQELFLPRERRRALGRECQVYRTGSALQTVKITKPSGTSYVDACLDDAGLLLEEVTVVDGKVAQRLTATELELDAALDPSLFAIEGERVAAGEGTQVSEIDRTVPPAPGYWALDTVPAGWAHRGRYVVLDEGGPSHVDLYVRGTDLVTVRQGAPAAEPKTDDAAPGPDLDLGALGPGRTVLATNGATLIAHPGSDAFVHVAGTLGPRGLQALASGLRRG